MPFPLKFIASYLVEDRDGWTVIDPGFDYPPAREAWGSEAARMGLDLDRDVTRIIVTHLHPDHIGLARWLERRSGAPVCMLEDGIANARHVRDPSRGSEDFVRYMLRHGMDPETAGATAVTTRLGVRLPERLIPLQPEDRIEFGRSEARVIHTPGHSDFHIIMHDEPMRLLFVGDHLLLKITPNIGVWPYTAPRPLQRYLDSIVGLRGLDVGLVFPGHGPVFHDLDGRIDELILHHADRLSVMHDAFTDEPATAFDRDRAPGLPGRAERPPTPLRPRGDDRQPRAPRKRRTRRTPRQRRGSLPGRVGLATRLRGTSEAHWDGVRRPAGGTFLAVHSSVPRKDEVNRLHPG